MEAPRAASNRVGVWVSSPFILGSMLGVGLAMSGATSNIIVYLIKEYNVKSIDAAQISNIINGCTSLSPVAGAIIADAFFGNYPVVVFSTLVSSLSLILFTLTAAVRALRPPPCASVAAAGCHSPSAAQLAVLYTAVALLTVAAGGTRFNSIALGASQFDEAADQDIFFNWYFIVMYGSSIAGATVIVYVQDSVSWTLGYGVCSIVSGVSLLVLLAGGRRYRKLPPRGSAFTGLGRVLVAAMRKRKIDMLQESLQYYCDDAIDGEKLRSTAPTSSFRFLNRAAVISPEDTHSDGTISQPWKLCTIRQVEDLKTILRIIPLWTSSILLSVSIGIQASLTVLQALTMDRSLGSRFSVPAGSIIVSSLAAVVVSLLLLDRLLFPLFKRLTGRTIDPLQRIGFGHLLNATGMMASALVERRRAGVVQSHGAEGRAADWVVPMTALWLVLPLAITGAGEAMHFPGQVALYYQEFPEALRSTAAGMVALIVALGFYLSTAVVDMVRKVTTWLPDNINASRLEKVYWMLAIVVSINFGYYLLCAKLYNNFLNSAAAISAGDTRPDSSLAKPWKLCTVEQVEDLKVLLRQIPLWSASIAAIVTFDMQNNLAILQVLTLDRSIGPRFTIPPGTIVVATLLGVIVYLVLLDRFFLPLWRRITGRRLISIQRICVRQLFYALSMVVAALVERRRLHAVTEGLPMRPTDVGIVVGTASGIIGAAEALHYPGQISLYYPDS